VSGHTGERPRPRLTNISVINPILGVTIGIWCSVGNPELTACPPPTLPHRFPACAADAHAPLARTLVLRLRLRTVRRSQEVVTVVLQCSASTNGRSGSWLCENALRELDVWQAMECGLVLSGNEPHVGGELCPHCRDERLDAEDLHDAREIVGQYMQGHLGCHAR